MCEIFYMRSKTGEPLPRHRIRDLIDMAETGSTQNPDGTGAFNRDGAVFKTEAALHEMNAQKVVDRLEGSAEVVVHLRMATTGSTCTENAHPFEHKGHVMVHNGVMRRTTPNLDDSTDSEEFLHQTVQRDASSTVQKLEESAERVRGSLSIFHRDLEAEETYYMRDRSSFEFGETTAEVVGATKSKRLDYLDRIRDSAVYSIYSRFTPETGKIYSMAGQSCTVVGEFDKGSELETRGGTIYGGYSGGFHGSTYEQERERDRERASSQRMVGTREHHAQKRQGHGVDDDGGTEVIDRGDFEGMTYEEYKQKRHGRDGSGWDENPWEEGSIDELPPWL